MSFRLSETRLNKKNVFCFSDKQNMFFFFPGFKYKLIKQTSLWTKTQTDRK